MRRFFFFSKDPKDIFFWLPRLEEGPPHLMTKNCKKYSLRQKKNVFFLFQEREKLYGINVLLSPPIFTACRYNGAWQKHVWVVLSCPCCCGSGGGRRSCPVLGGPTRPLSPAPQQRRLHEGGPLSPPSPFSLSRHSSSLSLSLHSSMRGVECNKLPCCH